MIVTTNRVLKSDKFIKIGILLIIVTLNNLIQPSDLGVGRDQRDIQIIDSFGVTSADLFRIRSERRIIDRIFEAAQVLNERLAESSVDPTIIPAQFTLRNLAVLIDDGTYNTSPPARPAATALKRKYSQDARRNIPGLNPTYTQLLKEDIGAYHGNLYQSKGVWKGFEVSEYDWLKDVRIPTKLGLDEAVLLAIFFSHGTIIPQQKDKKRQNRVEFFGRNCDFSFYERNFLDLILKVHNIIPDRPSESRLQRMINGDKDGYTHNQPCYEINSLALVSWLQKDAGMSDSKEHRVIPSHISSEEQKLGFLKGVIASLGYMYLYPEYKRLKVNSPNPEFATGLEDISRDSGFSPRIIKNRLVEYSRPDILEMVRMGFFINPHHVEQSYEIAGSIIQPKPRIGKRNLNDDDLHLLAFLYNCNVRYQDILNHFNLAQNTTITHYLKEADRLGLNVVWRKNKLSNFRSIEEVLFYYQGLKQHNNPQAQSYQRSPSS